MHAMVAIRRIAFHDCLIHIKAESANEAILTSDANKMHGHDDVVSVYYPDSDK